MFWAYEWLIRTKRKRVCREIKATLKSAKITFRQILINYITKKKFCECTWWSFITFAFKSSFDRFVFWFWAFRRCIIGFFHLWLSKNSRQMTSKKKNVFVRSVHITSRIQLLSRHLKPLRDFFFSHSSRNFAHLKNKSLQWDLTIELHDHYGKNIFSDLLTSLHPPSFHFNHSFGCRKRKRIAASIKQHTKFFGFTSERWRCRDYDIDQEREIKRWPLIFIFIFSLPGRLRKFSRSTREF